MTMKIAPHLTRPTAIQSKEHETLEEPSNTEKTTSPNEQKIETKDLTSD